MFYRTCVWILFVFFSFSKFYATDALWGTDKDTTALFQTVIKNVPTEVVPNGLNGEPLIVEHSLQLVNLVALENNVLVLNLWESMHWQNTRLQWSPAMFGVEEVSVPSRLLWQPDILLYNSAEEYKGFPPGDLNAVVQHEGNVSFLIPKITKSYCAFNNGDVAAKAEITCMLRYGSWTRSGLVLNLEKYNEPDIMNNDNPRWNVTSFVADKNVIHYQCCPDTFVSIVYKLTILPL